MKKLAAILLLALLAFNWAGYQLYMDILEERASSSLQAKLDRQQYEAAGLIEIRIPLNLPYTTSWSDFQSFQGETVYNGIHYNYVKRKLVNDTLILLCIANEERNQLRSARTEYFKQVNDLLPFGKKTGSSKDQSVKNPVSDYYYKELTSLPHIQQQPAQHHDQYMRACTSSIRLVQEQPPDC